MLKPKGLWGHFYVHVIQLLFLHVGSHDLTATFFEDCRGGRKVHGNFGLLLQSPGDLTEKVIDALVDGKSCMHLQEGGKLLKIIYPNI